jgi:hypothetical protein
MGALAINQPVSGTLEEIEERKSDSES